VPGVIRGLLAGWGFGALVLAVALLVSGCGSSLDKYDHHVGSCNWTDGHRFQVHLDAYRTTGTSDIEAARRLAAACQVVRAAENGLAR
jgi:hypothetical protein